MTYSAIDDLSITNIRMLAIDAIENANSGHPGMPMGAAPMAYVLWTRLMNYNPKNPKWRNRDRFVLSAGHGSMLLYSLLHLSEMDLTVDDIKKFRTYGSKTPGHPEYGHTLGIEATTGPLGQGFAMAVGMSIAERYTASKFNKEDCKIIDHHTYVICGDGDLMEGVTQEAASLAGHLKLGKLIVLYDSNNISLDGETDLAFTENTENKFKAMGWEVHNVADGNDLLSIEKAIKEAKLNENQPSLIIVKTTIGYGSPNKQGTSICHGAPLGEEERELVKKNYNWHHEPFYVDNKVKTHFQSYIERNQQTESNWLELLDEYKMKYPEDALLFEKLDSNPISLNTIDFPEFLQDIYISTRDASGKVLNSISDAHFNIIGGSADLSSSNKTYLTDKGDFSSSNYGGQNIHFGVREFAMGAILNGLSLYGGLKPFGATFLAFSDYMRPAIRMSALMNQPVLYIFSHDSIHYGEDGPTHQPIEHIPSLRLIPNLLVFRPADANETIEAYKVALNQKTRPTAMILSRQDLPVLSNPVGLYEKVSKGGYVLRKESSTHIDAIIIATGSEVSLADSIALNLEKEGYSIRVVSIPSVELFNEQEFEYKEEVIPSEIENRIILELASPSGWETIKGVKGINIGIENFAASAPGHIIADKLGYTSRAITKKIINYINSRIEVDSL